MLEQSKVGTKSEINRQTFVIWWLNSRWYISVWYLFSCISFKCRKRGLETPNFIAFSIASTKERCPWHGTWHNVTYGTANLLRKTHPFFLWKSIFTNTHFYFHKIFCENLIASQSTKYYNTLSKRQFVKIQGH